MYTMFLDYIKKQWFQSGFIFIIIIHSYLSELPTIRTTQCHLLFKIHFEPLESQSQFRFFTNSTRLRWSTHICEK